MAKRETPDNEETPTENESPTSTGRDTQRPEGTPPENPRSALDVINDRTSKRIRHLEEKVNFLENQKSRVESELDDLRGIVRKAGELPSPNASPQKPSRTVLDDITDSLGTTWQG